MSSAQPVQPKESKVGRVPRRAVRDALDALQHDRPLTDEQRAAMIEAASHFLHCRQAVREKMGNAEKLQVKRLARLIAAVEDDPMLSPAARETLLFQAERWRGSDEKTQRDIIETFERACIRKPSPGSDNDVQDDGETISFGGVVVRRPKALLSSRKRTAAR